MFISAKPDVKEFKNPAGSWEHEGSYTVEITPLAPLEILPQGVEVRGTTVTVHCGQVYQAMGGIQFYSGGSPWHWRYSDVVTIRDNHGNLLWVNNNYR